MAGKRQHYLPQFLQRGFASTPGGPKTWLYRKDVAPREVGLRDVGVEENFYNVGSDSSVDVAITDIERDEFVALIEHARAGTAGNVELTNLSPLLIAHLEVRSRHLRMTFGESVNRLLKQLLECLQDPGLAAALVREHLKRNPAELRKMAARELRSKGLPPHTASKFAKQMAQIVASMPDQLLLTSFWEPLLPHLRQTIEQQLKAIVKDGHVKALRRSVAPDVRAKQYEGLRFGLVDTEPSDLILGDAAVLFQLSDEYTWKPFLDKDDDLRSLYLPVTPRRVIVGSTRELVVDPTTLRREIAQTSHSFFISTQSSQQNIELSKEIGTMAQPLSEEQLHSISRQVIAELLPSGEQKKGKNYS